MDLCEVTCHTLIGFDWFGLFPQYVHSHSSLRRARRPSSCSQELPGPGGWRGRGTLYASVLRMAAVLQRRVGVPAQLQHGLVPHTCSIVHEDGDGIVCSVKSEGPWPGPLVGPAELAAHDGGSCNVPVVRTHSAPAQTSGGGSEVCVSVCVRARKIHVPTECFERACTHHLFSMNTSMRPSQGLGPLTSLTLVEGGGLDMGGE